MRLTHDLHGTRSTSAFFAVALVTFAFDADAQRRRPPRDTTAPTHSSGGTNSSAGTNTTSSASSASSAADSPSNDASSGRSATTTSSASSSSGASASTLVANTINHPGEHVTRVNGELLVTVAPGAWAWPWGGIATSAGFRLGVPLTRNGMLSRLNNDVRLMIGAQWIISFNPAEYWWITAPLALQWNFFLSPQWSVSVEAGMSVDVFVYDFLNCYEHPRFYCDRVYFHPVGGVGIRRHFGSTANGPGFPALEFRFSYPYGISFGLSF